MAGVLRGLARRVQGLHAEANGHRAAFAKLGGVAPIPASSGMTVRHRLDRSGDRLSRHGRRVHQLGEQTRH